MSFFRSLRFRVLLVLLIVAILPILLTALINLNTSGQLFQTEVEARQIEVTRIVANQVSQFIQNIESNLLVIGDVSFDAEFSPEQLNNYLLNYLVSDQNVQSDVYRNLVIMDADGQELAAIIDRNPVPAADLQNRRETEAFFKPARGEIYFSNVRLLNEQAQIGMAIPIYHEGGIFVGVVSATINLEETWDVIRELQLGETGYALLADERGNLIVHQNPEVMSQRPNLADAPSFVAALQGNDLEMFQYDSPLGELVIGSAVQIEGTNWVLILERPSQEAFATISLAARNTLITAAGSVLVALVLSVLLSRQITHPIVDLRDVVQRFGAGYMSVRSNLQSKDEIGQLATGFNSMADRLKVRIEEINLKNAELQIANEKSMEAGRLKDEFLAVMSHELRTPLNAIIGFTGLMLMDEDVREQDRFYLDRVENNSERLLKLINDILDISRIQAGRMTFNPVPLDLRTTLAYLHAQTEVLAKQKNLAFTLQVDEAVNKTFVVDEDAFTKILTNLMSNAIKFTQAGSVQVVVNQEAETLLIKVIDTGIGIPPQMQDIIFEEFRQVDSSSSRSYGGTGLGLAIVRRLCQALGGSITVKSKVNEGSIFTVNLPIRAKESELIGAIAHV